MTDFDDVSGVSIDKILRKMRAELINDLAAVLDIEAGLREAMIAAQHTNLVRDLRGVLDIDAGLSAIVPSAPAPFRSGDPGAQHGNANAWGRWALELVDPLEEGAAGRALREHANAGTKADAEALARRVGGLPLALHLAGNYLAETTSTPSDPASRIATFTDYLSAIDRAGQQAPRVAGDVRGAASEGNEPRQAQETVDRACELSLGLLASRGFPEARALLQILAYFAEADIPLEILDSGIIASSTLFSGQDARQRSRLVHSLAALGLVDLIEPPAGEEDDGATAKPTVLRIHPMVRTSSRVRADLDAQTGEFLRLAAALLYRAAYDVDPQDSRTWPLWQALAPHCQSFLSTICRRPSEFLMEAIHQAAAAALRAAHYQLARGLFDQVESESQQVLRLLSRVPGDNIAHVLKAREYLACLLRERGRLEEAEREFRVILQERMDLLSHEDQEKVAVLDQLARRSGPPDGRSELPEHGLNGDHARLLLDVFETRVELAITLAYRAWSPRDKDRYEAAAKDLYQTVYEARRRILGSEHPETLEIRRGLAIRLLRAGQLEEAEREFRAVYETLRGLAARGQHHPDTLTTLSWIASVLEERGELADSEAVYRDVSDAQMRVLGGIHPETLASRSRLAYLLRARGELDEAEAIYRSVYQGYKRVYGEHHHDTLDTLMSLAVVLADRGELDEAEAIFREVYHVRWQVLGEDHADTLSARYFLAQVLEASGQLADAESNYRAVLDAEQRTLGYDDPSTLITRYALAAILLDRGRQWMAGISGAQFEPETREPAASRLRVPKPHPQLQKESPTTRDSSHSTAGALHDPRRFVAISTEYRENFPDAEGRAVAGTHSS